LFKQLFARLGQTEQGLTGQKDQTEQQEGFRNLVRHAVIPPKWQKAGSANPDVALR
jgi:hypothetical protein